MEEGRLLTHLRRGTLEFCILASLRGQELYAGDLISALGDVLVSSEGTVYPLLARLRRDGLVTSSWRESSSGPPRRYYRVTRAGERALGGFAEHWTLFRDAVDHVLKGGS